MSNSGQIYRVLITGMSIATEALEILEKSVSVRTTPSYPESKTIAAMAAEDCVDGLIVRGGGQISREVIVASPNLKIIVKHGVGVDNIDVEAATDLGIPVCITLNASYQSVAEHALSMMFALAKNLPFLDRRIRSGFWDKASNRGTELFGKCLGIIGAGRIGRRLAELVQPFKMNIIGYDPFLPDNRFPEHIRQVVNLEELLREADFISIHCPKTPETIKMIGENELKIMKPTAILINTARGGIIDESALIRVLEDGKLRGAGLDCFENEPLPTDSPLVSLQDRLIMTSHIGGGTQEALVRMGIDAVNTLLDYLDGKELVPAGIINQAALARK